MSLLKDIELDTGAIVSYHKVSEIFGLQNMPNEIAVSVTVSSYLSQQVKNDGKNPIFQQTYMVLINPLADNVNIITQVYEKLKELDIFENAVDC